MAEPKPTMKMPELFVFARVFAVGIVGAEVFRIMYYLGQAFVPSLPKFDPWVKVVALLVFSLVPLLYAGKRGAHVVAAQLGRSRRLDLLATTAVGVWANELASPWLNDAHKVFKQADPQWAPAVLSLLLILLLSPLLRLYWPRSGGHSHQLYFIADDEIADENEDLLGVEIQAKTFADTVLTSSAHSGLVFGVDGPWGVGKTSFINLAERHWAGASNAAIVCRFEPLRYASEPDLSDRLIRDLSEAIQRRVFVPEFRPAASRYSRLLKGKTDISFLGFKLSLEPTGQTADELLDDIDDVLKRMGQRVIVVVDDLDRLDSKTVNNVLFATRKTFKLSQATYVLCYDTENLAIGKEDGEKAREFLEKFVTVKLSLFADSASIRDFLRRDWLAAESLLGSIPSDTMLKLRSVLSELAEILDSKQAAQYLPMVGDLRKVKRFVNAMLFMQIEKMDLDRTDFNKRDLINLILLHLNYPGVFRRIYAEETEGRTGAFSVRREIGKSEFTNSDDFQPMLKDLRGSAGFLLRQLFDVTTLGLNASSNIEEAVLRSRACFNPEPIRNLEKYLKLIVRFAKPTPQETFVLYQVAVDRVRKGVAIASVLASDDFRLELGEQSHDEFWRVLVSRSHDFTSDVAEDAISTLIEILPRYSSVGINNSGLRQRSIYSLVRLLDQTGWGRTNGRRLVNSRDNIVEIAWRIYGERSYAGKGLIQRLASSDRGVLGWNDLLLFRLQCSADRLEQLHNLYSALILHTDISAVTSGFVSELARKGMRTLSQEVFAHFKQTYIESKRNFIAEVDDVHERAFFGNVATSLRQNEAESTDSNEAAMSKMRQIEAVRTFSKSFVIYQLSNRHPPTGSGVGCGFYDEIGDSDCGGIAKKMNDYVFGVCFNPDTRPGNMLYFLDYCLTHLSSSFFTRSDDEGYVPTKAELPGGLDPKEMGSYWRRYRDLALQQRLSEIERNVVSQHYIATYREDLPKVFIVLDELAEDACAVE